MTHPTGYFTHDSVLRPNPMEEAPDTPERIDAIESRMMVLGLDDLVERFECGPANDDYLRLAHDADYVESLRRISQSRATPEDLERFNLPDTPVGPGIFEAAAKSVGAVVSAVDAVKEGKVRNAFCAVRPPGHHAGPARAGGFCYFNNVAIGALYAQLRGFPRVAVLDFDAHHGDGTEEILAGRENLHFWSLFQWPLYPDRRMTPVPANVTQSPLAAGADGNDLKTLLDEVWIPELRSFRPDFMLLSAPHRRGRGPLRRAPRERSRRGLQHPIARAKRARASADARSHGARKEFRLMFFPKSSLRPGVAPREVFGWAAFDFANSGYTTVVLTAVYNAYFVNVVAGNASWATLLWTVIIAVSSAIGMVVMPVIGTLADAHAKKRSGLFIATVVCIAATFGLTLTGEGTIVWAALMIVLSNLAFNIGETLNSAFLPEIASDEGVGKVSGWGWSFGYCGGLVTLGLSLLLVTFGPELWGLDFDGSVAGTLWITGIVFAVATVPTFAWLKERAVPKPDAPRAAALFSDSMASLKKTASALPQLKHFGRLTLTGFLNQCGVSVVITLSAVYATAVMGFTLNDSILLVFLVNITAAVGAFGFGYVEDKIGHKKSLMLTLWIWVAMIVVAATSEGVVQFWIAANLAGIAMGSSQSAGRAMVAVLSPAARSAEFYGFWNMALWFANIVGPLTYGAVTWVSGNNHRLAIAITGLFFLAAIVVLKTLDMEEGRREALAFEKKVG